MTSEAGRNEEMFFILDGSGEIRIGAETYDVKKGEICEYPDSDKVGVYGQVSAQEDGNPTAMRFIIRDQAEMADYWEGE